MAAASIAARPTAANTNPAAKTGRLFRPSACNVSPGTPPTKRATRPIRLEAAADKISKRKKMDETRESEVCLGGVEMSESRVA